MLTGGDRRTLYGQHPPGRGGREDRVADILIPLAGILGAFGTVTYIAYLIVDSMKFRQRALQARELQQKLLDRVTTAQDLGTVLSSPGTANLLTSLDVHSAGPRERIVSALQTGIVLSVLGFALFVYQWFMPLSEDGRSANALVATIAVALGIGLIGSGAVAYAMSQRLGMLEPRVDSRSISSF
jgi:hypothetical protein